jgi:hypothetical protein
MIDRLWNVIVLLYVVVLLSRCWWLIVLIHSKFSVGVSRSKVCAKF